MRELLPRLVELAAAARRHGLGLTIDAEEQDRLDLTLGPVRRRLPRSRARGLAGSRARRAGLRQARAAGAATGCAACRAGRQAHPGAARQGRLLGQRDQVGAGARACRLPRVHAQGAHRRVVSRLHAAVCSPHPAAFFPQFATHNAHSIASVHRGGRHAALTSSSACTAWARRSTRRWSASGKLERALPHLRAGRPARGPGGLSGAPPARERRQHLVRQPPGRRGGADRGDRSRSRRERRARSETAGQAAAASARHLPPERAQQRRPGARASPRCARRCWRRSRRELEARSMPPRPSSMAATLAGSEAAELVLQPARPPQRVGTVRTADAAAIEAAIAGAQRRGAGLGPARRPGAGARSWTAPPTSTSATARG